MGPGRQQALTGAPETRRVIVAAVPFRQVIVGTDGSEAAAAAVLQAHALRADDGELLILSVAETHLAGRTGMAARAWDERLRAEAEAARQAAESLVGDDDRTHGRVTTGYAGQELLASARSTGADLLAVGTHGGGRVAGIVFGSVATLVVHDAPCSVLLARAGGDDGQWPAAVTVGVDGSEHAQRAESVAREIADRAGATVRVLAAAGGGKIGDVGSAEVDDRAPLEALVDSGNASDLIVVGSRGLTGLAAIGSVAERVAHRAPCSVLIVR
jgi:nucleotide-binding universal stress UspA family protein